MRASARLRQRETIENNLHSTAHSRRWWSSSSCQVMVWCLIIKMNSVCWSFHNSPMLKNWFYWTHSYHSGVNFLDLHIRQGQFENLPKLPFVPGFECAGQIVKLGSNISNFKVSFFSSFQLTTTKFIFLDLLIN